MVSLVSVSTTFVGLQRLAFLGPSRLAALNAAVGRAVARSVALVCVLCAVGCTGVALNPYDQPYSDENTMKPQPLGGCYAKGGMDSPPQLMFGTIPIYPASQALAEKDGTARVRFSVSELGKVVLLKYESADDAYFADHAAIAMRDWRVQPATRNGSPVAATCRFIFNYKMKI